MARHDAIVIGGGLNGLTAAAYLARAGADVLVVERNFALGGAAASGEIAPGYRLPRYSLGTTDMPARIVAELGLADYGLRLFRVDGGIALLPGGGYHANYRDGVMQRRELARFSPRDADAWTRFRRDMLRAARELHVLLSRPMQEPARRSRATFRGWRAQASDVAAAPAGELGDLIRVWTLSCAELLDQYFTSDAVKSHLAAAALAGTTLGPSAPTSGRFLLQPFMDETAGASAGAPPVVIPLGGPQAVAIALAACVLAHGGQIRNEAEVTSILLRDGKARGVVLADGEEIPADSVLSGLDVRQTFPALFPGKELPKGFADRISRFGMRGVTAKVNIALDAVPEFEGVPADCPALAGGVRLAGSLAQMDRACDDWRERAAPRMPLIEALIPTLVDRGLAPEGRHVMSVQVHYVPATLRDGPWTPERRSALGNLAVARLAERSPGLEGRIRALETLVPPDIEGEVGLAAGAFAQGEMTLDQMFSNWTPAGLIGDETPIENFYLCSGSVHHGALLAGCASTHRGGRLSGLSGRRAAHAALARRWRP